MGDRMDGQTIKQHLVPSVLPDGVSQKDVDACFREMAEASRQRQFFANSGSFPGHKPKKRGFFRRIFMRICF